MFDLNEISSNIILIGFVIVGILCLYLLYSNFQKSKQIQDLQTRVEDIKNIFFNQQKHNDETHAKLIHLMQNTTPNTIPDATHNANTDDYLTKEKLDAFTNNNNNNVETMATKKININPNITNSQLLIKDNSKNIIQDIDDVIVIDETPNKECKEINIDLHDLDNMSDIHSENSMEDITDNLNMNNDEGIENDDEQNINDDGLETISFDKEKVFDTHHSIIDDDNESIATEQMISDADLNDIMNEEVDNDLDNIDLDLDEIDNVKQVNLDDLATLEETIVNDITPDESTKTITFDSENGNHDDTIELDKLLSGDVKKIELKKQDGNNNNKDTSTNDVNSMSLKQLKEHAKSLKIKTTGLSKQELINAITTTTSTTTSN